MGRRFFNKFKEKVKNQKMVLDSLRNRCDNEGVKEYFVVRDKLHEILLHEELYWKQRAKIFWLKERDENTRFFHASATARRKSNRINYLMSDNGTKVDTAEEMREMIVDYFKHVFAESLSNRSNSNVTSPRVITQEQNDFLTANVSFEEFTNSMSKMHPDKAYGPDGLKPAFYQNFWKILGKDVFECCKGWLQGNSFPANLNIINVILIPKKEGACCLKDLRPIALCNVLYKILAKVLANRLKNVLPNLISEQQSAFVPGRCITDNVVVALEIIHHMRGIRRGKEGDVALKLDISKAYDKVDWNFLKQRMHALGFL